MANKEQISLLGMLLVHKTSRFIRRQLGLHRMRPEDTTKTSINIMSKC